MKNQVRFMSVNPTSPSGDFHNEQREFVYPEGSINQGAAPMVVGDRVVMCYSWFEPEAHDFRQAAGSGLLVPGSARGY